MKYLLVIFSQYSKKPFVAGSNNLKTIKHWIALSGAEEYFLYEFKEFDYLETTLEEVENNETKTN